MVIHDTPPHILKSVIYFNISSWWFLTRGSDRKLGANTILLLQKCHITDMLVTSNTTHVQSTHNAISFHSHGSDKWFAAQAKTAVTPVARNLDLIFDHNMSFNAIRENKIHAKMLKLQYKQWSNINIITALNLTASAAVGVLDLTDQMFALHTHGRKVSRLFLNSGFWGWLSIESQPQNAELGSLQYILCLIFWLAKYTESFKLEIIKVLQASCKF